MKKILFGSLMLLFCMNNVWAQYTVFAVKGAAEMSVDGKTWTPLKKKDEMKESYQVRLTENSAVQIVDVNNLVYSYNDTKVVTISDIVKKRKTILEAMNEKPGNRKVIGGVERGDGKDKRCYLLYTNIETLDLYDDWDKIPQGTIFFFTLCNETDGDVKIKVTQELENKESLPCFSGDIHVEKGIAVQIKDILFVKQGMNRFILSFTQ